MKKRKSRMSRWDTEKLRLPIDTQRCSPEDELMCTSSVSFDHLKKNYFKNSFHGGSDGEESAFNAGDPGSIPGLARFPGEGNGYPLQYSCLENSMDRGAWQATVPGIAKGQTGLSN